MKTRRLVVWATAAILILQQAGTLHAAITPATSPRRNESILAASGTAWVDSNSNVTLVRVTDWRDGDDVAVPNENGSSFNSDASRFIINIDGQAVLFGLSAGGREISRQDA